MTALRTMALALAVAAGVARAAPEPVLDFTRQDLPVRTSDRLSEGFTAGDVDGDGRVDLCVVNGFSNDLSLLHGRAGVNAK